MKKRIMVDMDDVITTGGFLHLVNEYLKADYKEDDFESFYMQDVVPDKDEFFKWFKTYNMYDFCTLTPDVYEVLEELNKNYEIFIGTSYMIRDLKDSSFLLPQKYEYLINKFPFLNPNNFIFLGNKSVLNCDIKIDDRIDNLDGAKTKILFTAFHNKNISNEELKKQGIKRADNWKEIENMLLNEGININEWNKRIRIKIFNR